MKFHFNWLKKKERPIPENAICRNCGAQMQGRYCHDCGQDVFAGTGIPILKLIVQLLDNAFALEGRTPRTLVNLMFRPGFLSAEYLNGKVARYVNPVKLFWMSTIIFFALIVVQSNRMGWQKEAIESIKSSENIIIETNSDEKGKEDDVEIKKKQIINFISLAPQIFIKFAPYVSFILIPFFAILLVLFFWNRRLFYIHHLIFTIHFHTFLWIFYSLLFVVNLFLSSKFPGWLFTIIFFTPGIYLIFALHRFYLPQKKQFKSWWQTIWKSISLTILYFIIFCLIIGLSAVFLMRIYFPELAT